MSDVQKRMAPSRLFWLLAAAIPVAAILSTHLWLRTAYSGGVFHLQGFLDQYGSGVYRYRILGRYAVLSVYHLLSRVFHDQPLVMPRDLQATTLFYFSYGVVDALCFTTSNLILLLLLADKKLHFIDINLAIYFYLVLMQVLAMAVVTPYDQLSYLLILLSLWSVTRRKNWLSSTLLVISALAGALTRETQLLVTPALFVIALFSTGQRSRRFCLAGTFNLGIFSVVYIALRIAMPGPKVVTGGWTFGGTWALEAFIVLVLIFFINTLLLMRIHSDHRPTFVLLLLSTPYILTILISGALRELRLLIPLLLAQAFVYVQLEVGQKQGATGILIGLGRNDRDASRRS